jgi:hypothetical protein
MAPQVTRDATGLCDSLHLCQSPRQNLCLNTLPACLEMDLERQAAARLGHERIGHKMAARIFPQGCQALGNSA